MRVARPVQPLNELTQLYVKLKGKDANMYGKSGRKTGSIKVVDTERLPSKDPAVEEGKKQSAMDFPGSRLISTLSNGMKCIEVDGTWVRNNKYTEFMGGANPMSCKECPSDEFWFEEMSDEDDSDAILVHEVVEYLKMQLGSSYDDAHNFANSVEEILRGNVEEEAEGQGAANE
jgi:hypothetical protein